MKIGEKGGDPAGAGSSGGASPEIVAGGQSVTEPRTMQPSLPPILRRKRGGPAPAGSPPFVFLTAVPTAASLTP